MFILTGVYIRNLEVVFMSDRIEKQIDLNAPVERVWRALTDHREFGEWFRVELDGPFAVGKVSRGQITYPGYEHLRWSALIKTMEPLRLFAFTWCPVSDAAEIDFARDPQTLVEFALEATPQGTRLVITESEFNALPEGSRNDALRENTRGWQEQATHILDYVQT